jgi:hypothetical protein
MSLSGTKDWRHVAILLIQSHAVMAVHLDLPAPIIGWHFDCESLLMDCNPFSIPCPNDNLIIKLPNIKTQSDRQVLRDERQHTIQDAPCGSAGIYPSGH